MAPPTYNSAKHHIGLLESGTTYGFMIEGGYRKSMQRESLGAQEYGGQTDLIGRMPSISRWTQDAFEGGMGQFVWGADDAMFAECQGFMSSPSARSIQTLPPMHKKTTIDPAAQANDPSQPIKPRGMFMVAGDIYVCFQHDVVRHQIVSGTNTWQSSFSSIMDTDGTQTIVRGCYDPGDDAIWLLTKDSSGSTLPSFIRLERDLSESTICELGGPAGTEGQQPRNFTMIDGNILVQIDRKFYYGDVPDNADSGSTITWTKVGRIPGKWVDSTTYQGVVYILTNDNPSSPSYGSAIYSWDGTALLPVVRLPFNFYGKCILDYAGRFFIGGTGTDVNGNETYAELYEVTGGSVRLVKSFSPWARQKDVAGQWPTSIEDMVVFEGCLWWFARGLGIYSYDITSDGVFGAARLFDPAQTQLNGYAATSGRGRMWWYCYDGANPTTQTGIYRIGQGNGSGGGEYSTAQTSTFTTSDFAPEIAVKKRWGVYKTLSKYKAATKLEYSLNGGSSWTDLGAPTVDTLGYRYISTWDLSGVTPSHMIRIRISYQSTDYDFFIEHLATTMSFSMGDTGKKSWRVSVINAIEVETLDAEYSEATTQVQDITDVPTTLWTWAQAQTALTFTDVDGATYKVSIQGIDEVHPVMGPEISGEARPESLVHLDIVEV